MGNATNNKKIAIYDPYLDTLGGGERYILTIAEYFSKSAKVDIFWQTQKIKEKIKNRLNIDVNRVNFLYFRQNILKRVIKLRKYDLFFYVTDGSLFWSSAKHSVLIIQSPAHIPDISNFSNRIKLGNWSTILCYSQFVGGFIKKKLNRQPLILPPPVDIRAFSPKKKENIILSTGRFFSHLHSKKQDVLVDFFISLYKKENLSNWQLILIGSIGDKQAKRYLEKIREKAEGYPIKIFINAPFELIKSYYGRAKIFWLATGFDEDLKRFPEKAEHFGIVTVEAMATGCVPIVFAGGGQPEIVEQGKSGYLFTSEEELIRFTTKLIRGEDKRLIIAKRAQQRSKKFAKQIFLRRLDEIVQL